MKELYRVLKPKGTLVVQTPFKEGLIYEDYNIISEKARLKHFGQEDHVRIYSVNGLKKRLLDTGFEVEIHKFNGNKYNGWLDNEIILIAFKEINAISPSFIQD